MMTHRNYKGYFEYDEKADIFHGQVIGIKDVITFQGRSIDDLKIALKDSVDDYLEMCEEEGKSPDKPFSGRFSLRLPPELHSKVSQAAAVAHTSINSWITDLVKNNLKSQNITSQ